MEMCSLCGNQPARAEDQRYCAGCHRKKQKEYRDNRAFVNHARGFREGVEAMRSLAVARFEQSTFGQWAGWQAAETVRGLKVERPG